MTSTVESDNTLSALLSSHLFTGQPDHAVMLLDTVSINQCNERTPLHANRNNEKKMVA